MQDNLIYQILWDQAMNQNANKHLASAECKRYSPILKSLELRCYGSVYRSEFNNPVVFHWFIEALVIFDRLLTRTQMDPTIRMILIETSEWMKQNYLYNNILLICLLSSNIILELLKQVILFLIVLINFFVLTSHIWKFYI